MDLWATSACDLAGAMQRGETTSEAIVAAHLARIEAVDDKVNAFTEVLRDSAQATARERDTERAAGRVRGPLHGLPISVKECLSMKGRASTVGVLARQGILAADDAALVTLLREGGAVVLGRTNLSQGMIYAESSNPLFGATRNPFSAEHSPGGSSGGESAAIAAGMSCLGIGTDIGGSIRIPAAFCGIFGLMPSLDRWPYWGSVPGIPGQESIRGAAGPLARHADDIELLLSAFAPTRMAALDPRTPPLPWEPSANVSGKVFGVLETDGAFSPCAALTRSLHTAADALRARGARIVPFRTALLEEAAYLYLACMSADGGRTLLDVIGDGPLDAPLAGMVRVAKLPAAAREAIAVVLGALGERRTARVLRALGEKSVASLWRLHTRMRALRSELLAEWNNAGIDALLTPPGATTALPHGKSKDFVLGMTYTYVWNLLHFPAGVAPVTRVRPSETSGRELGDRFDRHAAAVDASSEGLPAGVQVVARPYGEPVILGAFKALERELSGNEDFPCTPHLSTTR